MARTIQAPVVRSERPALSLEALRTRVPFARHTQAQAPLMQCRRRGAIDRGLANVSVLGGKKTSQTFATWISLADATRGLHLP